MGRGLGPTEKRMSDFQKDKPGWKGGEEEFSPSKGSPFCKRVSQSPRSERGMGLLSELIEIFFRSETMGKAIEL